MRIIGGKFKGQRLDFTSNKKVRPITEKIRAALYDILQDHIQGATMLDLFCGSGGVGIEAISRGAASADFIDLHPDKTVKNVKALGITDQVKIFRKDVLKALTIMAKKNKSYDFIFIGAPYKYSLIPEILQNIDDYGILKPNGIMMLEHRKGLEFEYDFYTFDFVRNYIYGQTYIALFESKL